jgi:hypothetical protein
MLKFSAAVVTGTLTAILGTFLHAAYPPWGWMMAILGTCLAFWTLGYLTLSRRWKFLALLVWMYFIMRAGSIGKGGELLISGDLAGMSFLLVSLVLLLGISLRRS